MLIHVLAWAQCVVALWLFFIALLMETENMRSFVIFRFAPFLGGGVCVMTALYFFQVLH